MHAGGMGRDHARCAAEAVGAALPMCWLQWTASDQGRNIRFGTSEDDYSTE